MIAEKYLRFKDECDNDIDKVYDMIHDFTNGELDRGDLLELCESYVKLENLKNIVTVDTESKSEFEKRVRAIIR